MRFLRQLGCTAAWALLAQAAPLHDTFNSQHAYAYTAKIAGFGERWPGSPGHKKTEDLLRQVLQKDGARLEADDFTASTPRGPVAVHNIIGKFNVTADPKQPIFILAGHYDTLFQPGFIGANDGASSTAILLAFADALAGQKTKMQIWLLWTDLEEAIQSFTGDDGLYGSRHFAKKLAANGTASRVRGFFLLDMIGDKIWEWRVRPAPRVGCKITLRKPPSSSAMASTSSNTNRALLTTTCRSFKPGFQRWMSWTQSLGGWVRAWTEWASSTTAIPTPWIRFQPTAWKWSGEPSC